MAQLRIGTSGWTYAHWRGVFYPRGVAQRKWLEYYATHFDTVEINATFYRLPAESTFLGWHDRTPAGFLFAVKASRIITHLKRLKDAREPVAVLLGRARRLGDRLGPVLIQTPPGLEADLPRLHGFLQVLPSDLHYAFEFRHQSWFNEEVYTALSERAAAVVRVTSRDYPEPPLTAPFTYARMHGDEDSPKYSPETLSRWAANVVTWLGEGQDVFVYFNNDIHGYAIEDARALARMVER
jgi:uncharacterized protein YecE (DUF72 family)